MTRCVGGFYLYDDLFVGGGGCTDEALLAETI